MLTRNALFSVGISKDYGRVVKKFFDEFFDDDRVVYRAENDSKRLRCLTVAYGEMIATLSLDRDGVVVIKGPSGSVQIHKNLTSTNGRKRLSLAWLEHAVPLPVPYLPFGYSPDRKEMYRELFSYIPEIGKIGIWSAQGVSLGLGPLSVFDFWQMAAQGDVTPLFTQATEGVLSFCRSNDDGQYFVWHSVHQNTRDVLFEKTGVVV